MGRIERSMRGGGSRAPVRQLNGGSGNMKRGRVIAVVAGAALGLAGVAAAVALTRKEYRETAAKVARVSADVGARGSKIASELAAQGGKVAGEWAVQARKIGEEVARQAAEQYQAQAPRAIETLSGVLPLLSANKEKPATVEA
jgi:hypothetical protein